MKLKDRKALTKRIEHYYSKHKGQSLYFYPLAVLYSLQGEKEKAYQILLEGLQYYPRYVLALVKIAEILIEDNKYEAALAYLETAVNIQKYNTNALEYLAIVYEKLGRSKEALETYEKILSIEPYNEKIKSKIVELAPRVKPDTENIDDLIENVGSSADDIEGHDVSADDQLSNDVKDNPKDPKEFDALNNDSSISENIELESEIKVDEIPQVDLEDENTSEVEEEASVTLARLYEKQGYIEDAIEVYKKVLTKEPDNMEVKEALNRLEDMEKNNEKNS